MLLQHDCHGVDCELSIPDTLEWYLDSFRLQQVLVNLLDNALAFCRNQPQAKILICSQHTGQQLTLYVHNNGPAIPVAQQHNLFQPFVSKRSGGSGLGLAIVHRIMQAHGGEVRHRTDLGWPVSFELIFNRSTQEISDA